MLNSLPYFVVVILVFGNATALYLMITHISKVYHVYMDMKNKNFKPVIARIHAINDDYETVPNATLLGPIALIKVSYTLNKQRYLQELQINLRSELELLRTSEEMTVFVDNENPNLILSPLTHTTLTSSSLLFNAILQDILFLGIFCILFDFPFYAAYCATEVMACL